MTCLSFPHSKPLYNILLLWGQKQNVSLWQSPYILLSTYGLSHLNHTPWLTLLQPHWPLLSFIPTGSPVPQKSCTERFLRLEASSLSSLPGTLCPSTSNRLSLTYLPRQYPSPLTTSVYQLPHENFISFFPCLIECLILHYHLTLMSTRTKPVWCTN